MGRMVVRQSDIPQPELDMLQLWEVRLNVVDPVLSILCFLALGMDDERVEIVKQWECFPPDLTAYARDSGLDCFLVGVSLVVVQFEGDHGF